MRIVCYTMSTDQTKRLWVISTSVSLCSLFHWIAIIQIRFKPFLFGSMSVSSAHCTFYILHPTVAKSSSIIIIEAFGFTLGWCFCLWYVQPNNASRHVRSTGQHSPSSSSPFAIYLTREWIDHWELDAGNSMNEYLVLEPLAASHSHSSYDHTHSNYDFRCLDSIQLSETPRNTPITS